MTISEALKRFLTQLDADGRSIHTRKQYERHIRLLDAWLQAAGHSRRIERIDHELLARFLTSPEARNRPDGKPKKATATNALRTSIRCFFSYLHRAGYIRSDPGRLIRRAMCSPAPPRALSKRDQERLLRTVAAGAGPQAKRDHALFHLMLATGIRVGSAVALDIEDVDLESSELCIRTTKGNRPGRVFLAEPIRKHLREWIGDRTEGPLFQGHAGRRITCRHVARRLALWLQRAGVRQPASPHSLRHSFAIRLYARTGDILLVKAALLHRSILSTTAYADVRTSTLCRAIDSTLTGDWMAR